MCKYVRLIKRGRWPTEKEINYNIDNVSAKTIVQEMAMKGTDNSLSIWQLEDKEDIALAVISPNKQSVEKITAVKISKEELEKNGLEIKEQNGNSVASYLNSKHFDIVNMNYKSLGSFAKVIIEALKNEENLEVITQKEVETILKNAISDGRIDKDTLSSGIINEIEK